MIEIDHTDAPPPEPARPILASDLLAVEEKQRTRFSTRGERIRGGCDEIDDYLLGGGCERGVVVGISSEGVDGRLISLHLLSNILVPRLPLPGEHSSDPYGASTTKATIIDTTGSFPVSLLAKILRSRISTLRSKSVQHQADTSSHVTPQTAITKAVNDEVQKCLKMVAINRVFDIEGLWEVLGEVGRESHAQQSENEGQSSESGTEVIIIDNMTHLINELFARKERSEAHTLLTSLSRALHTLTHTHNILTLLHNTTVSATTSESTLYPTTTRKRTPQNPQPTSIFPSATQKPALGQIFTQFPDLHLLLNKLPKTRADDESVYAQDDEDGTNERYKEAGYCWVVEVLKDETPNLGAGKAGRKFGGREQTWAAVDVDADGLGFVDAFLAKGNMEGLRMEAEKRALDVGSVAKIFGFGGRRV